MISVSVVITGAAPDRRTAVTLASLAAQTLPSGEFEIVLAGPRAVEVTHDTLSLRRVTAATRHRAAALALARGVHVTGVEPGDTVTPGYLAAMLPAAGPARVAVAAVNETVVGGATTAALRLPATAGGISPYDRPDALLGFAGKVAPTALVRDLELDDDDETLWVQLFARAPFDLGRPNPVGDAIYTRRPTRTAHETADFAVRVSAHLATIAGLETITAPRARALVEALRARSVRRINEYLVLHPYQHANAVAEIRRRGLTDLPWKDLNRDVARDLAILFCALPYSDTSAIVAARRMRAAGVVRDVLSSDVSSQVATDKHAVAIWQEVVDRETATDTKPQAAWWPGAHDFCDKGLAEIDRWQESRAPYRSLYSRAMWPTSHLPAAIYKVRHPRTTWIAELSDPMVINIVGERRESAGHARPAFLDEMSAALRERGVTPPDGDNLYEWVETLTYALADTIVFTNDHQRDFMLARADAALATRARRHSVVEPHPTLPAEYYRMHVPDYDPDPATVNVAYFGVFYATRGLTEVQDALRALEPDTRGAIRLHVFTAKPDELATEAAAAGLADVIIANPYVSFLEFLNLTTRFDALLVNDARTIGTHEVNPYMPSKWSDYAGSGRPIWGIVEPGSVMSTRPLTYRSEVGDPAGARAVLEQIVRDKRAG